MVRGVTRVQGWWDLESPPPHFGLCIGCPLRARGSGHLPTSSTFIVVFYLPTPRRMRYFAVCSWRLSAPGSCRRRCCTFAESLPPYSLPAAYLSHLDSFACRRPVVREPPQMDLLPRKDPYNHHFRKHLHTHQGCIGARLRRVFALPMLTALRRYMTHS